VITAEKRARLRELAETASVDGPELLKWRFQAAAPSPAKVIALLDALDTAERERDDEQRLRRVLDAARDAAERHVEKLEAEVAAATAKAEEYSNELDDYETAVDDNLEGVVIDSEDGEGNRIERIEFAGAEVERLRADLARVTADADRQYQIANAMQSRASERHAQALKAERDLARVTGELAELDAAFDENVVTIGKLEDDLATSQRDREKLQGELDAARAVLKRALDRFEMRTREGIDTWEAIMAAARRDAGLP
jgi:chromosome segregation ATPase